MPSSRKEMAQRAVQHYNVSIRLACTIFSISQSCYYYQPKHAQENDVIADWLIRLTTAQRNWGFGLCFAYLRNIKGFTWNHKRVYRIMGESGLSLQPYTARPTKTHDGKIITLMSNLRWCSDGFSIQCWNGDRLQIAFSLDCHDREAITWIASDRKSVV